MRWLTKMLLLSSVLSSSLYGFGAEPETRGMADDPLATEPIVADVSAWDGRVPRSVLDLGDPRFFSVHAFVVDKQHRSLTIWKRNTDAVERIGIYPIDFGRSLGDKRYLGDHRTPEGIYFFQEKLEEKDLDFSLYGSRAFTMDYPNFFDRLDGKTGSGIWLHAVPDTTSLNRGSRGCVVVRNEVIKRLSDYVNLRKTPILVQDSIDLVSGEEARRSKEAMAQWLNRWRKAWEEKDIEQYIQFYSDHFKAMGMNRDKWLQYKKGLNSTYKSIRVVLSQPTLLQHKDRVIVRVLQVYQSDQHSDFGEKTLYLKKESDSWQILNEEWSPVNDQALAASLMQTPDAGRSIAQSVKPSDVVHD